MYLLRADRPAGHESGKEAGNAALGEDTEERESVGQVWKVGVKAVLGAKGPPDGPEVVLRGGIADTQAFSGLVLSKSECTAEIVRTVTIFQGCVCG